MVRVDLEGLYDFDVHSLCQPQIGEVDVFDSDVEENLGQADDEDSGHDDSEDSDFREWQSDGFEESDILLLDEEDDLSLNEGHKCPNTQFSKHALSKWVATKLLDEFKDNPNMDKGTMQKTLVRRFGVVVPDYTCSRARKLMKNVVEGSHDAGYKVLPNYMRVFKEKNPDSLCFINWKDEGPGRNPSFKRCQICIGSSITAFKQHCRPFIGIYVCHLKGPYKGIIITAMGLDGNNGQYPLAYGVAPQEDEEEWSFFLHGLVTALHAREDSSKYTIISDRHKGIIKALKNVMPQASRRIYVLHFYKNFASLYPGAWFHCFFYIAANAHSEFVFRKAMYKIKDKDISAFHCLRDNEPLEHWARFKFDQTLKVDDNTNNFVESFNNAIVKHRGKLTYTMLEEITKLIRARFEKRFQISADWDGKVTPFVEKKLKKVELESRNCCNLVPTARGEFDVREGSTNFTVKLADHYCDCQRWQVSGIPCKHAARCILRLNHKLDDYCYPWFNVESYRKLYNGIIHPIPDSCFWGASERPALDPPFELRRGEGQRSTKEGKADFPSLHNCPASN
ncbi:hypothetical protein Cgig2_015079 [Carnegiea gigantea]|uniref:SWIM-type domain-containing protein n=1 Tax=Carnegiea gigantea TaxID=171969 RepID=A0A9Q1GRK8_9CARY|nr:hypothetical protein Cgig2_015079 [Carnegiea gigantea]